MNRPHRQFATVLFSTAFAATVEAGIPLPIIEVHPFDDMGPTGGIVAAPTAPGAIPSTIMEATILNSVGVPIQNATVVVLLTSANPVCPGVNLQGFTDKNGVCVFPIAASGCSDSTPASGVIKANGVTIRSYANVKSPDYDGAGGNGAIDLADFVSFAEQFNAIDPAECHDYDNDEDCDVGDLVIFGQAFSQANHCP